VYLMGCLLMAGTRNLFHHLDENGATKNIGDAAKVICFTRSYVSLHLFSAMCLTHHIHM
jgi:hypothetical protein